MRRELVLCLGAPFFCALPLLAEDRPVQCNELAVVVPYVPTEIETNFLREAMGSENAKNAWDGYLKNVGSVAATKPFGDGIFRYKDSSLPAPLEIRTWAQHLNDIMGDRDGWVRWNIAFAERIRQRAATNHLPIYDSMLAELYLEAAERGFPPELLVIKESINWRAMLRQGKIFIDTAFQNRGVGKHTSIAHALQLLYLQVRLELRGYQKGQMSIIMKEFLGNHDLVESLKLIDPASGEPIVGFESPWYELFDSKKTSQAHRPEWFGELWHIVAEDIPYHEIMERLPKNYPPD